MSEYNTVWTAEGMSEFSLFFTVISSSAPITIHWPRLCPFCSLSYPSLLCLSAAAGSGFLNLLASHYWYITLLLKLICGNNNFDAGNREYCSIFSCSHWKGWQNQYVPSTKLTLLIGLLQIGPMLLACMSINSTWALKEQTEMNRGFAVPTHCAVVQKTPQKPKTATKKNHTEVTWLHTKCQYLFVGGCCLDYSLTRQGACCTWSYDVFYFLEIQSDYIGLNSLGNGRNIGYISSISIHNSSANAHLARHLAVSEMWTPRSDGPET